MLHVTRYSGYLLAAGLIAGVSFAAAPDLAASDTHRVRIDAEVVPGAGPIRDGVQFTIESLTGNFRQTVVSEPVGPVQLDLPEGRYMVTAVYDTAVVRDDLYVDGVDDYLTVNLNAGWVELDLIHGVGRPVKGDTQWVIETYGRTASG